MSRRRHRKREAKLPPLSSHHPHGAPHYSWDDPYAADAYSSSTNQHGGDLYYGDGNRYHAQPLGRDRDGRYRGGQQQYHGSGVAPQHRNENRDCVRRRHQHQKPRYKDADPVQYVFLPPILPPQYFMAPQQQHRGYGQGHTRPTKTRKHATRSMARQHRHSSSSSSSGSGSGDYEDERIEAEASIRNQRFRSIAAMSRLQHSAAAIIQQEYRFYRRRRINRRLHMNRLVKRANEFLDAFIYEELKCSLVPACLIESLKRRHIEDINAATEKQELIVSVADSVLVNIMNEALDECILEVFQSTLESMVKEYMVARIDLTRASMTPSLAIATDFLHDWLSELQKELLPEGKLNFVALLRVVLDEMVVEYFDRKQTDELYNAGLHEMLEKIAGEAMAESKWEALVLEELADVSLETFIELKMNGMVSLIADSGTI